MANRYSPMGAGSIFTVGFKGGEAAAQKCLLVGGGELAVGRGRRVDRQGLDLADIDEV
jgi:hypothetical protein